MIDKSVLEHTDSSKVKDDYPTCTSLNQHRHLVGGQHGLYKVYTEPNSLVCRAVDAAFDALYDSWILNPDCLAAIKTIDRRILW